MNSIAVIWEIITAEPERLTAWATVALVFITWLMLRKQLLIAREQMKVELQLKREEEFDSHRLISARATLARQLLASTRHEDINEDLLNFFETVGMLLSRKYLDAEMAGVAFSYYGIRWWIACKDYIVEERKRKDNDDSLFSEFQSLVEVFYKYEMKIRGKSRVEIEPTASAIQTFLREEATLVQDSAGS